MSEDLESLTLKAGTIVKVGGIPFELPEDTEVLGLAENAKIAEEVIGQPVLVESA